MIDNYMDVKMIGADKLLKDLYNLGSDIQREAGLKMTQRGAATFARELRKNCPVGKTGNLKKSIRIKRVRRYDTTKYVYFVGFAVGKKANYIGNHALLIEFGVKPHTIPKGGVAKPLVINGQIIQGPVEHYGFQGKRFVTHTFENIYPKAINFAQKALQRTIEKHRKY